MERHVAESRLITIPYIPRKHFVPVHNSLKRWLYIVAHRRAGKSVAITNHLIRGLLRNTRRDPPPRAAYVGPSFTQAKDTIWTYLKHYAGGIPDVNFSESELTARFPTGALFSLYGGAAAYERMRGLYFDIAAMDEFALLNPNAFESVIRPCLADYRGSAIISGTSAGADHFYKMKKYAEQNAEDWDVFDIKVYDTDALHPDEIEETRLQMSPSAFAREFLNSFEAPVEGAYYEDQMLFLDKNHRIVGHIPWDPRFPVITCWDIGITDQTAIWWLQHAGREIHVLEYYENKGKALDHYTKEVNAKPYQYAAHILPHDAKARELGTGMTREEILNNLLETKVFICPPHTVSDGIEAVRALLPMCWFDKKQTEEGVAALRGYQARHSAVNDTNIKPVHNWASHGADALRYGAVALEQVSGWSGWSTSIIGAVTGALKRKIKGII